LRKTITILANNDQETTDQEVAALSFAQVEVMICEPLLWVCSAKYLEKGEKNSIAPAWPAIVFFQYSRLCSRSRLILHLQITSPEQEEKREYLYSGYPSTSHFSSCGCHDVNKQLDIFRVIAHSPAHFKNFPPFFPLLHFST
jgi:hypothetical protein